MHGGDPTLERLTKAQRVEICNIPAIHHAQELHSICFNDDVLDGALDKITAAIFETLVRDEAWRRDW